MRKKTHEEFIGELFDKYGNEYVALSDYVNSNTKITIRHNKCGHIWNPYPLNILRKSGCPECKKKKLNQSFKLDFSIVKESFKKESYILLSNENDYINAKSKLKFTCPKGHSGEINWNNFNNGQRCLDCGYDSIKEKQRKDIDDVMKDIEDVGYELISFENDKYENTRTKVTVSCKNGHITTKTFSSIMNGHGCPHCVNPSKSEVKIAEILTRENVSFVMQYRIPECRNKRELPFDFAIIKDDNVLFLLEFDGRQHFMPVKKFGGEDGFRKTQENDQIKNAFCKSNNISLERISYKQSNNIEKALLQLLEKYQIK